MVIALLPMPFFVWYLWTWMKGVAEMDELQRRIELEALGFAFPAALVVPDDHRPARSRDHSQPATTSACINMWLMLPLLYYVGLWRAKRRYQ